MANFDKIICPFCFGEHRNGNTFSHKEVHFRMETVFDEFDLNDEHLPVRDVERMNDGPRKEKLLQQISERSPFLWKDDENYTKWWKTFVDTSEVVSKVDQELFPKCKVYQLPVLNPQNPHHSRYLLPTVNKNGEADIFIYDKDGMVIAVRDIHGRVTHRRVCPDCHNPLPPNYGKFPVRFLSVIGVTGSGKTVYISQLLRHMRTYAGYVGMTANYLSSSESQFIEENKVNDKDPLPKPTGKGRMTPPLFYDLSRLENEKVITNTIVIYDIAGEHCKPNGGMDTFGKFVLKSDGILLLVDPGQLHLATEGEKGVIQEHTEPSVVLNTIHTAYTDVNTDNQITIPIAVCVSKSDTLVGFTDLMRTAGHDITPIMDETGMPRPLFNASEYNELEKTVKPLIDHTLRIALNTHYKYYNYFVVSATGVPIEMRDDGLSYLLAPPSPRRIAEPLLWLFKRFGYIKSDVPIRLPVPRPEKEITWTERRGLIFKKDVLCSRSMTDSEKEKLEYEED